MTKEELKKCLADVHVLIGKDSIGEAIDKLLDLGELIGKKEFINDLLPLSGRFKSNERKYHVRGILDLDEYNLESNKIKDALLTIISYFEDDDDDNKLEKTGRSTGKLIHNIPSKMQIGKSSKAYFRIAKEDNILLKGFVKSPLSKITPIDITARMSLNLEDMDNGACFEIDFKGESNEQQIFDYKPTEWFFTIKPKVLGEHTLLLYVNIINKIDDSYIKTLSYFEEVITVVMQDVMLDIVEEKELMAFSREEKIQILPPLSDKEESSNKSDKSSKSLPSEMETAKKTRIPKFLIPGLSIAATALFILFVFNPFVFYNKNKTSAIVLAEDSIDHASSNLDSLEYFNLKLRLDQNINAKFVIVNKDTIDNDRWNEFSDNYGRVITIENDFEPIAFDLGIGKASILVLGVNGKATGEFELNLGVDSIYNLITILKDSSAIKIVSKTKQKILFNNEYIKPDSTYSLNNQYVYRYLLKNGRYKISIEKQENTSCKVIEVLIRNDSLINLECKTLPKLYKCSIRFPFENPNVYFNETLYKSTMEHPANILNNKGWIYSHKVNKGEYLVKVEDPKSEHICEPKKITVINDIAVAIICTKKTKYFTPTLRLRNGGMYSKDNITIVFGNNKIEPKVTIDKMDLIFYLPKIEEGSHDLLVNIKRNNKSVLNCVQQDLYINSNKEYIIKGCKEGAQGSSGIDVFKPKLYDVSMRLKNGKKYANDNISIILNGEKNPVDARFEKNDLIFNLKNLKKGANKVSINVIRNKITVLSCINQQIMAGDKKEYIFEGCKEK